MRKVVLVGPAIAAAMAVAAPAHGQAVVGQPGTVTIGDNSEAEVGPVAGASANAEATGGQGGEGGRGGSVEQEINGGTFNGGTTSVNIRNPRSAAAATAPGYAYGGTGPCESYSSRSGGVSVLGIFGVSGGGQSKPIAGVSTTDPAKRTKDDNRLIDCRAYVSGEAEKDREAATGRTRIDADVRVYGSAVQGACGREELVESCNALTGEGGSAALQSLYSRDVKVPAYTARPAPAAPVTPVVTPAPQTQAAPAKPRRRAAPVRRPRCKCTSSFNGTGAPPVQSASITYDDGMKLELDVA